MNAHEIQSLCIAGTDVYLDFLVNNDRGTRKIHVIGKERLPERTHPTFKLTLGARVFDPDCITLELRPPPKTYGPEDFNVVEYDRETKVLIIQVRNSELALDATPADNIKVVEDLRFLVKNVKRWYESNGHQLLLPQNPPAIHTTARAQQTVQPLESCQRDAVTVSLGKPLTYVWGPPGTGKTKHVLAEAALQLLLAEKRIGLFAPTNNALEQAMRSIIKEAEAAGISRDKFLRVGHPSTKFARTYPEVCEVQGLERQASGIQRQIEILDKVLHHRRAVTVLNSIASLRHQIGALQDLLGERLSIYEELALLRSSPWSRLVHYFDGKHRPLEEKLTKLEKRIGGWLEMIRRTQTKSQRLNAVLERIDFTNVDLTERDMTALESATSHYIVENQALVDEYRDQPGEGIQRLIASREEQLEAIEAQTVRERIKSARMAGMTLDCFIGRFHDTLLPFDHIFMDEAGYAPLVKALTLCRAGIPMTFLGDHKQLGPVCEMNDDNMNTQANSPAIVWRKSALHIDELFLAENQDACVQQLFELTDPRLMSFVYASIDKTFRFGQNLADLLSVHVYQGIELVSAECHQNLEISYLDAVPTGEEGLSRQSHGEVKAISEYLHQRIDLGDTEAAYAILTPYKNQVSLIGESLAEARRQDRIMTVHKAQGREWDTVIISIVDGRFNRPWFTDTTNLASGGLQIMNTAISRARKRLVIVCDVDFWARRHNNQLISRLLNLDG